MYTAYNEPHYTQRTNINRKDTNTYKKKEHKRTDKPMHTRTHADKSLNELSQEKPGKNLHLRKLLLLSFSYLKTCLYLL